MAGARPTLTAITDDASRGGLFTQSNIVNPVSGADIQGTIINDSTITLSITINGEVQTQTFTTNQAAASTESFDFTVAGGTGGSADGVVNGGSFDPATGTLTLTRSNNEPSIPITGFTFTARTDMEINDLADARIAAANISDLTNVDALGVAGTIARVNPAGTGIEFVASPPATVTANSFSSVDDTVMITQMGNLVDLEARPAWEGNANTAPTGTTTVLGTDTIQAERITLAADTGLVLVNNGAGAYTIQAAGTTPPPAGTPTATTPPPTSALDVSPPQTITVTPTGGTFDTTGGATPVRPTVTPPPGASPITPTTNVGTGGTTATVTIPGGDTNDPGNYMVMIETDTTGEDGMVVTETISETIERFVPFLQSRTVITPTNIGTASQAAWSGEVTSIPGTGTLYIGVLETALPDTTGFANIAGFPVRVVRVGTAPIAVPSPSGTISMNVFQFQANAGVSITNFRSTR